MLRTLLQTVYQTLVTKQALTAQLQTMEAVQLTAVEVSLTFSEGCQHWSKLTVLLLVGKVASITTVITRTEEIFPLQVPTQLLHLLVQYTPSYPIQ